MRFEDIVHLGMVHAWQQKRRFIPGLLGVTLGVSLMFIVITAVATLFQVTSSDLLQQHSLRQITITPGINQHQGLGVSAPITDTDITTIQHIPHVISVYPILNTPSYGVEGSEEFPVHLTNSPGVADQPVLTSGRWLQSDTEVVLPNTKLPVEDLDASTHATALDLHTLLGKEIQLALKSGHGYGSTSFMTVVVVGLYRVQEGQGPSPSSYVSLPVIEHMLATSDDMTDAQFHAQVTYPVLIADVDDPIHVVGVAHALQSKGYSLEYTEQTINGLSARLHFIETLALSLVLVIILVAIVAIGNAQAASVLQRRTEIGIMLAVGFTGRAIGVTVITESLTIALAGTLLGIGLSLLGILLFISAAHITDLVVVWWAIPLTGVTILALSVMASLLPTLQAMRTDVIDILRRG